jgi:hypothetical protein
MWDIGFDHLPATEVIKTIRASGGDYTTLSAWEAALPTDLMALHEQHTAVCYNDWPSGLNDRLWVAGPVTDATRFIKVTVAEGHRHNGIPKSGFHMYWNGVNEQCVGGGTPYTVFDHLDAANETTGYIPRVYHGFAHGTVRIQNCIGSASASESTNEPVFSSGSSSNTSTDWPTFINCLAIRNGVTKRGSGFNNVTNGGRSRANYYNCIATGFFDGFQTAWSSTVNCVAYDCITDFISGWQATSASSDGTGNITGITSADFVDSANGDFHLAPGSVLIGAGTNLYSTFTTDIDGDTRPSSGAWDIGFDHYVVITSVIARPISDTSAGGWTPSTGTVLYDMLDEETFSDTDYITTSTASTCTLALGGVVDPGTSANQKVTIRAKSSLGTTLVATLKQGSTVIATRTFSPTSTYADYDIELTAGECDAITDYTSINISLEAQ